MRFSAIVACGYVSLDCAGKATGSVEQALFAPQNIWIWWIAAGLWMLTAIQFFWWNGDAA